MIHKYKLNGLNIVLDVNSGGVHLVDELTYDMLDNVEPPFETECPQKVIDKLYKLGVDIQITEIDMEVTADKSEIFDEVPRNAELLQTKKYSQMFEVLRKNSDKISSVTFWGVSDNRQRTDKNGDPYYRWELLFDRDNMPKNAFYAVCDF